jgi:hypothetical protein
MSSEVALRRGATTNSSHDAAMSLRRCAPVRHVLGPRVSERVVDVRGYENSDVRWHEVRRNFSSETHRR